VREEEELAEKSQYPIKYIIIDMGGELPKKCQNFNSSNALLFLCKLTRELIIILIIQLSMELTQAGWTH
jgi:hypothetical protein